MNGMNEPCECSETEQVFSAVQRLGQFGHRTLLMKDFPLCSRLRAGAKSSTTVSSLTVLGSILLAGMLLLQGCALSPQTVTLTPLVDAAVPTVGRGRPMALSVNDARETTAFGSRGGLYGDTALLVPGEDVAQSVRRALAERLTAAGFRVMPGGEAAPHALSVDIRRLSYRLETPPGLAGGVINDARTEAILDAVLTHPAGRHGARYQAGSVRRVVGYPSEADNVALLNEVVAQALRQLLQDPRLQALLAE